jgi:hypothetical protein
MLRNVLISLNRSSQFKCLSRKSFLIKKNDLHIKSTFPSYDIKKSLSSMIIETSSDQSSTEVFSPTYFERSKNEFFTFLSKHFQNEEKDLIIIKLNQCLIDSEEWNKGNILPIYLGHVMMGLFHLDKEKLTPYDKSLVSKVPNKMGASYFESPRKFITSFFSDKTSYDKAFLKGSKEYYWIVDIKSTKLTIEKYEEHFQAIIRERKEWRRDTSACGQAVKRVLNGMQDSPSISPQTAAREGILDILKDDHVLKNSLMIAIEESGLGMRAYDLGKIYKDNMPQSILSNTIK